MVSRVDYLRVCFAKPYIWLCPSVGPSLDRRRGQSSAWDRVKEEGGERDFYLQEEATIRSDTARYGIGSLTFSSDLPNQHELIILLFSSATGVSTPLYKTVIWSQRSHAHR